MTKSALMIDRAGIKMTTVEATFVAAIMPPVDPRPSRLTSKQAAALNRERLRKQHEL